MNPATGHLINVRTTSILPEGYEVVPSHLDTAARRALNGKQETTISLTSGGKLSQWAAGKRKQRNETAKRSRRRNRAK